MVEHFIARLAKQAIALTDSSLSGFYGRRSAGVANKLQNLTTAGFNAVMSRS